MQQTGGRRYVADVGVRWSDLDVFGHVNNARILTLLEEARVEWLFVAAVKDGVRQLSDGVVVSKIEVAYRKAIGFREPVSISMGVTDLQAASFTIDYRLAQAGRLAVEASTVLVPVDAVSFRPRRLTEAERGYFAGFITG